MPPDIILSHSTTSERRSDSYSDEEGSSPVQVQSPSTESQEYTDSASAEDEAWDFVAHPSAPYPDDIEPSESASRPRTTRHRSATQPRPESVRRKSSHRIPPVRDPPPPRRATHGEGHHREYRQPREHRRRPPSDPSSVESHEEYYGPGYARAPPHGHLNQQWAHVPHHPPPGGYPPSMISYHPFAPADAMVPYPRHPDPYGYPVNPFAPGLQGHSNPFSPTGTTTSHGTSYFNHDHHAAQRNLRQPMPPGGGHEMMAVSPGPYYPGGYPPYGVPYYNYPPHASHSPAPPATRTAAPGEAAAAGPAPAATPAGLSRPSAADEQLAKMMALLVASQEREAAKDAEKAKAARKAQEDAEETKKKADEDKLKKLHDLFMKQQEQAAARDKKMLETDKAIEAALKAKDEKDAAAKKAKEEEAAKLAEVARKAREEVEAEATKKAAEAKKAADEAIAEAKKATEEAEAAKKKAEEEAAKLKPADSQAPIRFKDAVGRKFQFPFHLCKTWNGMESLIKQAFMHVDVIGPHVAEGHYDLLGPNNEIILPQIWDTIIQPDWSITMMMWPMPEEAAAKEPAGGPPPPPGIPAGPMFPTDFVTVMHPSAKDGKRKDKRGSKPSKSAAAAAMPGMPPVPPPPPVMPMGPGAVGVPGMMMPPPPPPPLVPMVPMMAPDITVMNVGPDGMRPHKSRSKRDSVPSGFLRWTAGAGRSQSLKRSKKT